MSYSSRMTSGAAVRSLDYDAARDLTTLVREERLGREGAGDPLAPIEDRVLFALLARAYCQGRARGLIEASIQARELAREGRA